MKKNHALLGRIRPLEVRAKISQSLKGKKKSIPGYWTNKTGPEHPSYKHGNGKKNRDYDPSLYSAWVTGVKQLYDYKCFVTQKITDLQCHHLNSWDYIPGRYDISNGLLLAKKIHTKFHSAYGSGKNTKKQMEDFLF